MTILRWDLESYRIFGSLFYSTIEGSFDYNFIDLLRVDLNAIASQVFSIRFLAVGSIVAFTEVTSDLDGFAFGSVPEARYRIGSYSWYDANLVQRDENNLPIGYIGIPQTPEFLVYPIQQLRSATIVVQFPNSSRSDYEINFDSDNQNLALTNILDISDAYIALGSGQSVSGLFVNLNSRVVANLKLFYYLRLVVVSNSEQSPTQPIYF